jgi:putative tryptophan/tyrosine transport system substrate-binding protein
MRRREFITLIGGAVWPLAARAQQPMPVIGILLPGGSGPVRQPAFIQALSKNGFVEDVEFDR